MSYIKSQLNHTTSDQAAPFIENIQAGIGFLGGRYFFHKDRPHEKLAFKEITKIFIDRCQSGLFIPSVSITNQLRRLNREGNQLLIKAKGIVGILLRFFHVISQLFGNRFKIINHRANIQLIESFIPKTSLNESLKVATLVDLQVNQTIAQQQPVSSPKGSLQNVVQIVINNHESITQPTAPLSPKKSSGILSSSTIHSTLQTSEVAIADNQSVANASEHLIQATVVNNTAIQTLAPPVSLEQANQSQSSVPTVASTSSSTILVEQQRRGDQPKRAAAIHLQVEQERKLNSSDFEFLKTFVKDVKFLDLQKWTFPITIDGKQYHTAEFVRDLVVGYKNEGLHYIPILNFRVDTEESRREFNLVLKERIVIGYPSKVNFRISEPPILDVCEDDAVRRMCYCYTSFKRYEMFDAIKNLIDVNFSKLPNASIAKALPIAILSTNFMHLSDAEYSSIYTHLRKLLTDNCHHIFNDNSIVEWQKIIKILNDCFLFKNSTYLLLELYQKLLDCSKLQYFVAILENCRFNPITIHRSGKGLGEKNRLAESIEVFLSTVLVTGKDFPEFMYEMYRYTLNYSKDRCEGDLYLSCSFKFFETDDKFQAFVTRFYREAQNEKEKYERFELLLKLSRINCKRFEIVLQQYLLGVDLSKLSLKDCEQLPSLQNPLYRKIDHEMKYSLSAWFLLRDLDFNVINGKKFLWDFRKKLESFDGQLELPTVIEKAAQISDDKQAIWLLQTLIGWHLSVKQVEEDDREGLQIEEFEESSEALLTDYINPFITNIFSECSYDDNTDLKKERVFNCFLKTNLKNTNLSILSIIHKCSKKKKEKLLLSAIDQSVSNAGGLKLTRYPDIQKIVYDLYINNPLKALSISDQGLGNLVSNYTINRNDHYLKEQQFKFNKEVLKNLPVHCNKVTLVFNKISESLSTLPTVLTSIIIDYSEGITIELTNQISEHLKAGTVNLDGPNLQIEQLFQEIQNMVLPAPLPIESES